MAKPKCKIFMEVGQLTKVRRAYGLVLRCDVGSI